MKIVFTGSLKNIINEMESMLISIKNNPQVEITKKIQEDSVHVQNNNKKSQRHIIGQGNRPRDKYYNIVNDNWDKLKNIPGKHVRVLSKKPNRQSVAKLDDGTLIGTNVSNKDFENKIRYIKELLGIWK